MSEEAKAGSEFKNRILLRTKMIGAVEQTSGTTN
jgi:hypothetical protein